MELVGQSQGTFSDMLTEMGLSAAMRPQAEYTLLAPLNTAFNGEQTHLNTCQSLLPFNFHSLFALTQQLVSSLSLSVLILP